ncbi:MAG: hypothetical protein Q7T45_13065 [Bradyrhizobium sp.]|uniref:hypothetical protein n=1 Tax=Bradyrhizobium sp. TaxID=376 RepID=UPI0027178D35|nr:hypothetical protein [Bradyrhizobium sp.]MDO8398741.1 hypothetical protein [Bradyrhizobium sp.]
MPKIPEARRPPLTAADGSPQADQSRYRQNAPCARCAAGEPGPMPWDQIDRLGDTPFMPGGRDQPAMPADRVVFDE